MHQRNIESHHTLQYMNSPISTVSFHAHAADTPAESEGFFFLHTQLAALSLASEDFGNLARFLASYKLVVAKSGLVGIVAIFAYNIRFTNLISIMMRVLIFTEEGVFTKVRLHKLLCSSPRINFLENILLIHSKSP